MAARGKFERHKLFHLLLLSNVISPLTCKIWNFGLISNNLTSTCRKIGGSLKVLSPLSLDLTFTWICRDTAKQYVLDDLLDITTAIPSPSESNLDRGGCYGTGAGKVSSNGSLLWIDSGYMVENSSYLITVIVEKGRRRADYTQEVVIVPGDPPEVMITYV